MRRLRRLAIILVVLLIVWLSPAHAALSQAILLGPDSLFPQQAPQAVLVTTHGRHGTHLVPVPVPHGRLVLGTLAGAALHGRREPYIVYLPPGYDAPANAPRRYPVLYLLHGSPGQPRDVAVLIADNPNDGGDYAAQRAPQTAAQPMQKRVQQPECAEAAA